MTEPIDLRAVQAGRAELARLVAAYPELRGERGPANVQGWIDTLESDMDRSATCQKCGKPFVAERKTARFCSDACRAAWNRRRDERGPSDLAAALMKAAQLDEAYDAARGFPDAADVKRARDQALRDAHDMIAAELRLPTVAEREAQSERASVPPAAPVAPVAERQLRLPTMAAERRESGPRFDAADIDALRAGVRAYLARTGRSQRALSTDCRVDHGDFSRFMNGKKNLSDEKRAQIAAVLNGG